MRPKLAKLLSKVTACQANNLATNVLGLGSLICNMSFAIQNCNSLNISTNCPKQLKKIRAITDLDTDFIFLSDIRLNDNKDSVRDLENIFMTASNKQYILIHNSTKNKRGVGILISKKINCDILEEFRDNDENIIGIRCNIDQVPVMLIGIYGPNTNDCKRFYDCLADLLVINKDVPVIIGGDWNCTMSCANVDSNIDIFGMKNVPSLIRSCCLRDICNDYNLSDPFRALYPKTTDFTYTPRNNGKNRSRLDFFVISDNLIELVSSCKISSAIATELFDHKSVKLCLSKSKFNPMIAISPVTLKHEMVDIIVKITVVDTYLTHLDPAHDRNFRAELTERVGNCLQKIREINDMESQLINNDFDPLTHQARKNRINELTELLDELPSDYDLDSYKLSCDNDIFLEVLLGNIKNAVLSFQSWIRKTKNIRKNALVKRVNTLKENFKCNANEIFDAETELNQLAEVEIRAKIETMKLFECLNSEKPTPLFLALARGGGVEVRYRK